MVSEGGATYSLRLRTGLEYSDGSAVLASDFEHAIARVLSLDSPGAPFYLGIAGARRYLREGGSNGEIEGISADDRSGEIEIELRAPDATFANALALSYAALVPGSTPFADQSSDPPPGVGPYEIAALKPGGGMVLARVPGFDELDIPDLPTGNLARITILVRPDLAAAAEDVLEGELDFLQSVPAGDLRGRIREQAAERLIESDSGGVALLWLNAREPPFDDERVRRAAGLGIDRPAIARLLGAASPPGCNLLPATVAGFEAIEPCPYGDPAAPPDLDRARSLVAEAGAAGASVRIWGRRGGLEERIAVATASQLSAIGLDARPRLLGGAGYAARLEAVGAQAVALMLIPEVPHPAAFLGGFSGEATAGHEGARLPALADRELSAAIDALRREPDLGAGRAVWAEVDRALVERAYAVPLGNPAATTLLSERLDPGCAEPHPVFGHDYARFCLAE